MYRECFSCNNILLVPRHSEHDSRSACNPSISDPNIGEYFLPVIASPMDRVYSKEMDELLTSNKVMVMVHRYFKCYEDQLAAAYLPESSDYRFFAVGSLKNKVWIDGLLDSGIKHFCVDMAHGDTKACVETVKYLVDKGAKVIAGNVATKSGFSRLQDAGAWGIRVGIGSGSICSTRTKTGFGVPLLSSIEDCNMIKDTSILIADGGMKEPGDLAKAIAFGADMCMLGGMFASTDLAPGDCYNEDKNRICAYDELDIKITNEDGQPFYRDYVRYKHYRGMASSSAREGVLKKASIEGVDGLIPYTGTTKDFVENLYLNLQASLSYGGETNWKDFRRKVKKIKITNASWNESLTHVH